MNEKKRWALNSFLVGIVFYILFRMPLGFIWGNSSFHFEVTDFLYRTLGFILGQEWLIGSFPSFIWATSFTFFLSAKFRLWLAASIGLTISLALEFIQNPNVAKQIAYTFSFSGLVLPRAFRGATFDLIDVFASLLGVLFAVLFVVYRSNIRPSLLSQTQLKQSSTFANFWYSLVTAGYIGAALAS